MCRKTLRSASSTAAKRSVLRANGTLASGASLLPAVNCCPARLVPGCTPSPESHSPATVAASAILFAGTTAVSLAPPKETVCPRRCMHSVMLQNSRCKPDFLMSRTFDGIQTVQHPVILRGASCARAETAAAHRCLGDFAHLLVNLSRALKQRACLRPVSSLRGAGHGRGELQAAIHPRMSYRLRGNPLRHFLAFHLFLRPHASLGV